MVDSQILSETYPGLLNSSLSFTGRDIVILDATQTPSSTASSKLVSLSLWDSRPSLALPHLRLLCSFGEFTPFCARCRLFFLAWPHICGQVRSSESHTQHCVCSQAAAVSLLPCVPNALLLLGSLAPTPAASSPFSFSSSWLITTCS